MTKVAQLVKGLVALGMLTGLVVGVPWALCHFVGWPLPHQVPSAAQVGRALNRQGISAQTLVDALAVVVWLTWATLVASLAVEIPAALSGRHAPRLPIAGAFQPVTGRLVAAIIVACLTLAPRPAHPGTPGSSVGPGSTAGRPVAALVVRNATLTASVTPAPSASTTSASAAATGVGSVAPAQSTSSAPTMYVVQRGDTLWGIAQRELGDPLRWSEIYQLNEGRPQPDGTTLTDPHWINPGWTLLLPATGTPPGPAVPTPAANATSQPQPSQSAPTGTSPTATAPTATAPNTTVPSAPRPADRVPGHHAVPSRNEHNSEPVRLPSGSVVGGSFVAGVLSAVALGRLRRRHAYRYRPPAPGRNLRPDPPRPTLRHLTVAVATNGHQPPDPDIVPPMADDDVDHRERPDLVEIGTRDGHPVELALSELGGITVTGPAAAQVVAAWVTAVMTRAGPRAAQVVATRPALDVLFGPGGCPAQVPGLWVLDGPGKVIANLERTVLTRSRQLAEVEVPDVVAYRQANPWEPVPMILAIVDHLPGGDDRRWSATTSRGPQLGFAAVSFDPNVPLSGRLAVGEDRVASVAAPDGLAARLDGVELFGLTASEAADVLAALAESEQRPDSTDDREDVVTGDGGEPGAAIWPMVSPPPDGGSSEHPTLPP
ncbi:MAG TPA: LysM peptidoglycan-binding domain-containing protein, partial [Acidimicrobiales bacterium]